MDISAILENDGYHAKNPYYKKGNGQPEYIITDDPNYAPRTTADLFMQAAKEGDLGTIGEYEGLRKYIRRGITPARLNTEQDYQKTLAERQSNWEKLRNALDQTVINEIVLGTLTGFADLYDIILGRVFKNDEDYQNAVSKYLEGLQEQFKESHEIYQDPTKTDWKHWSDFGWWMNNIPSIMSSLTLLIPGAGVGKGVSYVGKLGGKALRKGVSFTRKAGKGLRTAENTEKASRLARLEHWLNKPNVQTVGNRVLENGTTALSMRLMENYQESRQVYNDMMDNVYESLGNMTPEERQDFLNRNKDLLEEYGVDINNNKDIAKAISKESADETFKIDMSNLLFDVIQVSTLGNPLKLPKNLRRTAAVNKAEREARLLGKFNGDVAKTSEYLANRSAKRKTIDWLSDHARARGIVVSELSEGVEEAVNYIAQQEGMHYGNTLLDPEKYNENFSERWNSYLTNSEFYESAFWGVLGGVMFEGGGSAIKRAYGATVKTARNNKQANDETQEGQPKTTWRREFETTENKVRTEEINKRYANLEILKGRRDKIYNEHKSPFKSDKDPVTGEELSLDTQVERDAAWQRAVDEFIVNQTFMAIDAGNYDLLKDYLRDPEIKKIVEGIGNVEGNTVPKIDTEDLIRRMDEVEKIYTDNLIMVNGLAGDIKDVPIEYVNIIARDNTMAQIKAQRIQSKIDGYEASARANEFRFGEALKDYFGDATLDYKTAVSLITATNYLQQLRAAKQQILDDKKHAGSVEGQMTINEIDYKINSLTEYVKTLQPSLIGYESDSKLFGIINSLFATQQSLDPEYETYSDFLAAMAGRDITKLNEITGNNFELTDEEIIKVFGEEGTATGAYYKLNSELTSHFGTNTRAGQKQSKFEEIAPNLADDYLTLASLNVAKLLEQSQIANTKTTVNNRVQSLHNTMNEARVAAINKSRDIIVKNAEKYGRDKMINYVFNNVDIDNISEEDKKELDDAITILNLTNPLNKNVADMIFTNILLGDYQASVKEAKERKNSSTNQNSSSGTNTSGSNNPSTSGQNPNTSQGNGIGGRNPIQNPTINPTTNPTINPNPTPTPTPTPEPEITPNRRINVNLDIDKGISFSFTTSTENKGIPFIDFNGAYRLDVDNDEVSQEDRDKLVKDSDLFEGYDPNNKGKYRITRNPVLIENAQTGELTVDRKGQIVYESANESNPSGQPTTLPTGDEEPFIDPSLENMSEEEAAREAEKQKHNERELQVRREVFVRMLSVAKPMVNSKKSSEEITAAIEAEAAKYRSETADSAEFEEGIQSSIDAIKEAYDLVGVAAAAEGLKNFKTDAELRSSTIVEKNVKPIKENGKYTEDFINQVYELVKEYCKAAKINQAFNGKFYIDFEDFIRNINNLYHGLYEGKEVYDKLKDFFASEYNTQVVITDNINDPNLLENAKKTVEQRIKEKIGKRENYRVGIDELFEEGNSDFIAAFNSLKVGDKLQLGKDNKGRLAVKSNGIIVGIIGIPNRINNNTGFEVINKGWITDTYANLNSSKLRNHLRILAHDNVLNDMINSYLYDKLSDDKKEDLTFKLYEYLKGVSDEFLNEKYASPKDIVDWIANIWRYRMTAEDFSKPAGERSNRIDAFIDRFFEKLYDSYSAINDLIGSDKNNIEIEVANINDGELLRAVDESEIDLSKPRQSRDNYDKFNQSSEAFAKPDEVKVGVVTENGILTLSKNESIDHDRLGTNGTVHVVIPNRSGKPQFAIATSVVTTDPLLDSRSDAAKIIDESRSYIKRALDEFLNNPSDDNYKNLVTVLSDLFEHDEGHASIFAGIGVDFDSNGNISLKTGKRYLKIYKKGSKQGVDFIYNPGTEGSAAKPYTFASNEDILRNAINNIFNRAFFNVDFKFVNDNWNENNGAIGYTNDGKQFVIKVNGKVFRYKNMSEAFIKGGLLRVNTKVENGSNYRRKGISQGGNQLLEVSLNRVSTTPVERNDGGQPTFTPTQQEVTGADILNNEDANDAVDKLIENALPNLKKNDKKGLKDLGLLPKSIKFVSSLVDNDGNPAIAQVNPNTADTKVSQIWIDMYDGNGEFSDNKDFNRKQAIRKLIHEMIHVKVTENGREETLKQIKKIYDEFEIYLNSLNEDEKQIFNKYLFKNKQDVNERLEEFLVESFTSQELSEKLNSIEAKYEEGELDESKSKETLWDKIIKLIAKIFNYSFTKTDKAGRTTVNIDKKSLLQKELYALAGALNTNAETNTDGTPAHTVTEPEPEEEILLDDDTDFGPSDGNGMYSTTIENLVPESIRQQRQEIEKEMQDIKSRTIADGTFMKAPNGKPSNLNERQWLQVRTKAFKEWFGDWENNIENSINFNKLLKEYLDDVDKSSTSLVSFIENNDKFIGGLKSLSVGSFGRYSLISGKIYNSSIVVDENGEPLVVYNSDKNNITEYYKNYKGGNWFSSDEKYTERYGDNKNAVFLNIRKVGFASHAINYGSVIDYLENVHDMGLGFTITSDIGFIGNDSVVDENNTSNGIEFSVLDPNQIKSATDNVGTFSKENNDIRYSSVIESAPTHSSPLELISSLNPEVQSEAARMIENGELTTICK